MALIDINTEKGLKIYKYHDMAMLVDFDFTQISLEAAELLGTLLTENHPSIVSQFRIDKEMVVSEILTGVMGDIYKTLDNNDYVILLDMRYFPDVEFEFEKEF